MRETYFFNDLLLYLHCHHLCAQVKVRKQTSETLIYGKALSNALSLTSRNLAVPNNQSKTKQRRRPLGMLYLYDICISRGLRRCSLLTDWAMPEPLDVGRVTDLTPTLFYILAGEYY